MAPQADPQGGEHSYIDLVSFMNSFFKTGFSRRRRSLLLLDLSPSFSWKAFCIWSQFGLFLEEHIAVRDGFYIIQNYGKQKRHSKQQNISQT